MMETKRSACLGTGRVKLMLLLLILLGVFSVSVFAESGAPGAAMSISTDAASGLGPVVDVQKYNRSIHVLAMLLVGFGFLMVFVRRYGRSALTATYLLVSVSIPVYYLLGGIGAFEVPEVEIDRLILAEFGAASLLICAGAVLGRLKMLQYIVLAILFMPCYMINEWLLVGGGLLPRGGFVDTGGSILIHAFGALFGLGVAITMTTKKELTAPVESDDTSDRFSMVGSMVLWVFWPSFCAALVAPELVPYTAVNVVLSLCGATIATYFATVFFRGRKISIADMANAALAGGVAIGSTCDHATHTGAFVIGILAGVLSVFGFAVVQSKLEQKVKAIDTCGVMNLHGWPGLGGGIAALFLVSGISRGIELAGIGITIAVALIAGYITGKILSIFGRRIEPYVDSEEFVLE
jgi:ammonium transporter Rh